MDDKTEITISVPNADIPLVDVPAIVAKLDGSPAVTRQTVYSWVHNGKMGPKGDRVFLETTYRLGAQVTSLAWIKAFVNELNGVEDNA